MQAFRRRHPIGGVTSTTVHRTITIPLATFFLLCVTSCKKEKTTSNSTNGWKQQGTKLVGTGAFGNAGQGNAVSFNGNGNTVAFTGYTDNNNLGAAWVFTRSGNIWAQQGNKLVGSQTSGKSQQGAIALSADGNTLLVGGSNDKGTRGAVWVFTRTNNAWVEQTKLTANGAKTGDFFGTGVGLSADGNTAVVSGYSGSNQGGAWVFTRTGSTWTQQGDKLVGTGTRGNANQGIISLSADGNTFVLGGFTDNNNAGAAWVFSRTGSTWIQQGEKLVGSGAVGSANQGQSVTISGDGNTLVIGGPGDNNNIGAAWVFVRTNGAWTQLGSKLVGSGASGAAAQGKAVAISGDGGMVVIGGNNDNVYKGAVWVFTRSSSTWSQQGGKVVPSGLVGSPGVGGSVAVNIDGTIIAAGGAADDAQKGAVWIFTR